ncbi:MAG: DUF3492 domain-containing protein [Rhodocyclaceae bacterium]
MHLETHFLHGDTSAAPAPPRGRPGSAAAFADIDALHHAFRHGMTVAPATVHAACSAPQARRRCPRPTAIRSRLAICEHYRQHCADPSFVDYFWSVRIAASLVAARSHRRPAHPGARLPASRPAMPASSAPC